jgi:plastocyanin
MTAQSPSAGRKRRPRGAVGLLAAIALLGSSGCADGPGSGGTPAAEESPRADAPPPSPSSAAAGSHPIAAGAVVSGIAAAASGGFSAVVTLAPTGETGADPRGAGVARAPVFMDQIASAFYPPTLLTRVGQTVDFLNSEGVMHNVNVASDATGATVFNIATPPGFESYPHTFDTPGVYRVKCDIHPNMSAFIVAVTTPYAALAAADGRFQIRGVPPGSYQAEVWSLDESRRVSRSIEIPSGSATVELDLQPSGPSG